MKRALMRNFSLYFLSPQALKPNPNLSSLSSSSSLSPVHSIRSGVRFFSTSKTDSSLAQNKDAPVDVEDVSSQELMMLIDKLGEGDGEAIPQIFEAILKRKLSRKHEESDDEFMEELRKKPVNSIKNKENKSDSDEFDETDEELVN